MAKRRKRAPGGGRKIGGKFPGGERWHDQKRASLTVRLQPETRRALDEYAAANNLSVSAVAEHILIFGLKRPVGQSHNQSLGAAIAALADQIETGTGRDWRADRFSQQALQAAILGLMLEIEGDDKSAPTVPAAVAKHAAKMPILGNAAKTPDGFGGLTAHNLLAEIKQAGSREPPSEWSLPIYFSARPAQLALIHRDLLAPKQKAKPK